MSSSILKVENVVCGYDERPVLNGISLYLSPGETILLAGPNGCGKSTLLKAIVGALPLTSGHIFFDNDEFKSISTERRINAGIGYLRQTANIFPSLTSKENLELSGLAMSKRELSEKIDEVLENFNFLKDVLGKRAGTLSGGQRQALAIAMVLLHPRTLYLLDEPTAGLSPKAASDIIEQIKNFALNGKKCTVLMVEHRLELLDWVSRAYILLQGKIKAETTDASKFLDAKWLAEHYF